MPIATVHLTCVTDTPKTHIIISNGAFPCASPCNPYRQPSTNMGRAELMCTPMDSARHDSYREPKVVFVDVTREPCFLCLGLDLESYRMYNYLTYVAPSIFYLARYRLPNPIALHSFLVPSVRRGISLTPVTLLLLMTSRTAAKTSRTPIRRPTVLYTLP